MCIFARSIFLGKRILTDCRFKYHGESVTQIEVFENHNRNINKYVYRSNRGFFNES
jgi:hypothetical protein